MNISLWDLLEDLDKYKELNSRLLDKIARIKMAIKERYPELDSILEDRYNSPN